MPRRRRNFVPGVSVHVVQRGNNKQDCFHVPGDRLRYLGDLREASMRYEVDIHAYVLMTNHVHMLLTPTTETGVSSMMQYLGRSYVKSFNRIYQRTGTLWEGRFRSLIVDTEQYLFACYRYIELNPVRAGLVIEPQDYPWSSYSVNALGSRSALIKPRQEWVELGATAEHRHRRYREMFDRPVADDILNELRTRTR